MPVADLRLSDPQGRPVELSELVSESDTGFLVVQLLRYYG